MVRSRLSGSNFSNGITHWLDFTLDEWILGLDATREDETPREKEEENGSRTDTSRTLRYAERIRDAGSGLRPSEALAGLCGSAENFRKREIQPRWKQQDNKSERALDNTVGRGEGVLWSACSDKEKDAHSG